jgi:site-specific recombinase XerD
MAAKVALFLDARVSKNKVSENEKEKGKDRALYPVKIKVTFKRERRYYGLDAKKVNEFLKGNQGEKYMFEGRGNFSITKDVFQAAMDKAPRGAYRELNDIFRKITLEYQEKVDRIDPFSFEAFSSALNRKKPENDVFEMLDQKIKKLEVEERIGTAITYRNTLNSLKKFTGKNSIPFEYFTVENLKRYEAWMKTNGKSISTTGIYLRSLRALFNEVIISGITDHYPFGKGGFQIQKGSNRKIALNTQEIELIFKHKMKPKDTTGFYFDLWKLIYLLNGINIKDLVLLKNKNIEGEFICFVREKTKNTTKEQTPIKLYLSENAKQIIDKWKGDNDGYILPLISESDNEKEIKQKVSNLGRAINQAMEKIARDAGVKKKINCYTARHSWATQMMQHGAPVSFIGKQLGHVNSSTTDVYLNSFDDDVIKQWQKKLIEF